MEIAIAAIICASILTAVFRICMAHERCDRDYCESLRERARHKEHMRELEIAHEQKLLESTDDICRVTETTEMRGAK